jgi:hypothetical protein
MIVKKRIAVVAQPILTEKLSYARYYHVLT